MAPMKAWAMAHDGKVGFEVYELELPFAIIERYCVKRHPPNVKSMAIGIVETKMILLEQTPVNHHRPDNSPARKAETLE
jgi:hypothetical protein